jgi:hypothetical protein
MLVVGDCFAAKPSAQHATTATCGFELMETLEHKQRHKTTATCDFELMETLEHKQRHKRWIGKIFKPVLVKH